MDVERLTAIGWETVRRNGTDWLKIPIFYKEQIVNHKYRTLDGEKKFRQDANARKCFYNHDCLFDKTLSDQPLIITEGELDAESAKEAGFQRVVSVPDGAPAVETDSQTKFSYLLTDDNKLVPELTKISKIILAVDNDTAGQNLYTSLRHYLGTQRCQYVTYPWLKKKENKRHKDLSDVLEKFGPDAVVKTIEKAQYHPVNGIFKLSDLPRKPHRPGLALDFPGLRDHYNPRKGDFVVVTGIPSHGKTTVCINVAFAMARQHGWRIVMALFETELETELRSHLLTLYFGHSSEVPPHEMLEGEEWIDRHFLFIVPQDLEDADLDWLNERFEAAILRFNADMAILDPWNEIDHASKPGEHITDYTGRAIKRFKRMARYFDIHLVVTAHPTKEIMMGGKNGKPRKPNLYDIEGSRHWYGKADIGIVVHRDFDDQTTEIDVAKVRYQGVIGSPGKVRLYFKKDTRLYYKNEQEKTPTEEEQPTLPYHDDGF